MEVLNIQDWTPEYFINHQSKCTSILENNEALSRIPSLNDKPLHHFKDQQIVRYCGMIQDIYNPEFYFEKYEVKNKETQVSNIKCGMYSDTAQCLLHEEIVLESQNNVSSERQTYVIISTPGLNDWAKNMTSITHQSQDNVSTSNILISKRNLDENDCEDMDCSEPVQKKEKTDCDKSGENSTSNKRNIFSKDHHLNFPIPISDGKSCIVKIYDDTSFKVNQILEIIGFISFDSAAGAILKSEEMMDDAEVNTHNPPVSLIPRLHAIKVNEISQPTIWNAPQIMSKAQCIKNDLHIILTQLLFGDTLAADYMICHLLSSVYARNDVFCLGTFPLNVTNIPVEKQSTFPQQFYDFLKLFVRKSHFLELTVDTLNDLAFIPKKDYECNRLTSGMLQLSNNTHLVIDETKLNCGQLSSIGRQNYNALGDLIRFQKVGYDFQFYAMDYDTNIPVLILSQVKSFVPCPNQVLLKIDDDSNELYSQVIEAAKVYLQEEDRLDNIRQYLQVMQQTKCEFSEHISNVVEEDFVQMRKMNGEINGDSLHNLLEFARLLCLSDGKSVLETEYWNKAVKMDMERMERLPKRNK